MGALSTAITQLWVLHFGLVFSLHGGFYARAKEHARSQTLGHINSPTVIKKW